MKKFCISFIFIGIIILLAVMFPPQNVKTEYLRIHIRANSNTECDQNVKYRVKSAVVEFLTPIIAQCDTKAKAETALTDNLKEIERTADAVLAESGFLYTTKARVNKEEFPTRVYDGLTLENGFYDALILELGSGKGDNWWCVAYPPLCFVDGSAGGNRYVYRSKIKDIIEDFFKNNLQ